MGRPRKIVEGTESINTVHPNVKTEDYIAPQVTDPALQKDLQKAQWAFENAQKRFEMRKKAPTGATRHIYTDPVKELIQSHCPEAYWQGPVNRQHPRGTIPPTWNPELIEAKDRDVYLGRGHKPLMNQHGEPVQYEDMLIFLEPYEWARERQVREGKESSARLKKKTELSRALRQEGLAEATDKVAQSLTREKLEVTIQGETDNGSNG